MSLKALYRFAFTVTWCVLIGGLLPPGSWMNGLHCLTIKKLPRHVQKKSRYFYFPHTLLNINTKCFSLTSPELDDPRASTSSPPLFRSPFRNNNQPPSSSSLSRGFSHSSYDSNLIHSLPSISSPSFILSVDCGATMCDSIVSLSRLQQAWALGSELSVVRIILLQECWKLKESTLQIANNLKSRVSGLRDALFSLQFISPPPSIILLLGVMQYVLAYHPPETHKRKERKKKGL